MKQLIPGVECGTVFGDRDHKQWLVGSFMPQGTLLHTSAVKIKFSDHQAGEGRPRDQATTGKGFVTLSILLIGKIQYWFKDATSQEAEYILDQPHDFIVWGSKLWHAWEVLADSSVITICWPEQPAAVLESTSVGSFFKLRIFFV